MIDSIDIESIITVRTGGQSVLLKPARKRERSEAWWWWCLFAAQVDLGVTLSSDSRTRRLLAIPNGPKCGRGKHCLLRLGSWLVLQFSFEGFEKGGRESSSSSKRTNTGTVGRTLAPYG